MIKAKFIKPANIHLGQLVVVNDNPETQVYTIGEISTKYGAVVVFWFEGEQKCVSTASMYNLMKPTLEQIEFSIAANGRLASGKDI